MRLWFVCLFPEFVDAYFNKGILGKAREAGHFDVTPVALRDFGIGNYQQVDDYPYGEQKGMLLRADVLAAAIRSIPDWENKQIIYPCAKGPSFDDACARQTGVEAKDTIFLVGHFEGVDARIFEMFSIRRYRVGELVLHSGELPALAMADAMLRYVPGVVGSADSVAHDTYSDYLLEHRHYTRPQDLDGLGVPEVLFSGDHARRERWQRKDRLRATLFERPELLDHFEPTEQDRELIEEIVKEIDQ